MEDTLVGFEVAKLAKEKGFDGFCFNAYNTHKMKYSDGWLEYIDDNEIEIPFTSKVLKSEDILAPTQSLLQRWLREEHGLIISIEPTFTYALTTNVGYYAYVKKVNKEINTLEYLYLDIYFSATYEESLESGLLEALKLI